MQEKELTDAEIEKVVEDLIFIQKPFGRWKNFNDCVKWMRNRGYSADSSKRICGKLKAKLEGQVSPQVETVDDIGMELKSIEKELKELKELFKKKFGDK